eukprot:m.61610 g.61610  ORF g.61610 m.61610 type:complete len:1121 (+) comp23013_c0_seq1:137-3499(+)
MMLHVLPSNARILAITFATIITLTFDLRAVCGSPTCGFNPGGAIVMRKDQSTYPYFGMPCNSVSDCGQCDTDDTCSCQAGCCAPTGGVSGNYTCLNQSDFASGGCDLKNVGGSKTITELAALCDAQQAEGCAGFNNDGYLKRCVRAACGAVVKTLSDHPTLVSCFRSDTPLLQPLPKGCSGPNPSPPGPPGPEPPYAGRCAVTADRPDCTCSGHHPPFGEPTNAVKPQPDFHFPPTEPTERSGLVNPLLLQIDTTTSPPSAVLLFPQTGTPKPTKLTVGQTHLGWTLLSATPPSTRRYTTTDREQTPTQAHAVLEYVFDEWAEIVYVFNTTSGSQVQPSIAIRKPIGRLDQIAQPVYNVQAIDTDYSCKQDIDPTDWLKNVAVNMSGGEEVTVVAAASVMAPNTDAGLLGNPEEYNKFTLDQNGVLYSMPWGGMGPQGSGGNGYLSLWDVSAYTGCFITDPFPERKLGMVGKYLRAVDVGVWGMNKDGLECGSEVMAVSPPVTSNTTSTALLRVSTVFAAQNTSTTLNITYVCVVTDVNGTKLITTVNLGTNGDEFYTALLAQWFRWTPFVTSGSVPSLPHVDQRYSDTALSLLTMYMNLNQGLIPQYGAGQFWNTYNVNFPLPPLALAGALLEWGHMKEATQYLGYFLKTNIDATSGTINYKNFGCDSDADYGRLIDTFVTAVRYSADLSWTKAFLPIIHAMTTKVLSLRAAAVAAFPQGSPLHGIVPGSPEHDICHFPGYFFSLNVWHVRGLLSLGALHMEYPSISINSTLEQSLVPTANAWRQDIRFAANFTAVRKADGSGDLFFLSPVVGSVYNLRTSSSPPLLYGGDETDCVNRTTCFASMSAALPGGGSNQHTNYANFRIFSETLLAGILDDEYELAIMNFRESHRGTLLGMTRFRDVLDDMPILGYGKSSLRYDRLTSFHATLAGHTMNYMSRGGLGGSEQRQQNGPDGNNTGISGDKYRNFECGIGGEDCSLCMVSGVASSYWIRWMLVSEHTDEPMVYIARGAPRRWYQPSTQPFGITSAPTRFGVVNFTMTALVDGVYGSVALKPFSASNVPRPLLSVHIRQQTPNLQSHPRITVIPSTAADVVVYHAGNETAVFQISNTATTFNFTATW